MESTIIISTIIVTSLLWQTTEVYGKSKCFNTHTDTVETLNRLFQRVSEWMESSTSKMWFCPTQDRLCRSLESTPWPWVAEYVKHLERHGKCTMIVVTTIVRFSTEESLENCESMIFTKRVNSFQWPICKDKTVISEAFKVSKSFLVN